MDTDIIVTLKRSNDLLMTFGNDYSDVFLPAIDEIGRLRLANSDLQMHYDYARTECDKLQTEVLKLREELKELRLSYEVVVDALREKE